MHKLIALCIAVLSVAAPPAHAQNLSNVAVARILPGWRDADGIHYAALEVILSPGWKTYWRAPGDAGIPPDFNWSGSVNLRSVGVAFPVPDVMDQNGFRSIGYHDRMVLPLALAPQDASENIRLSGEIQIGVCEEICVPVTLKVNALLSVDANDRSAMLTDAMADRPMSEKEAGVGQVKCEITPIRDGLSLTARIDMAPMPGEEVAIVELADRGVWVAEPEVTRTGGTLVARTEMIPPNAQPFVLARSDVRITILAGGRAVDIQGCD